MRSTRLVILSAWLAATLACGVGAEGPPAIQVDHTACSHCRMLVSEPRFAAAYRAAGAEARVFDDIGCLLASAAGETTPLQFWFQDAAGGGWIEGADAVFVRSSTVKTPMSGGILAFATPAAADAAVKAGGRRYASLDELRAAMGGGS